MKLLFHLEYHTCGEEKLYAVLYRHNAGAQERKIGVPLSGPDGRHWYGEANLLLQQPLLLHYHYEVRQHKETLRREWQTIPRKLELLPATARYFLYDQWRDLPARSWLYTSCMTDIFRKHTAPPHAQELFERTLVLRAQTPRPGPQEELCVCGSCEELGHWEGHRARSLTETSPNEWSISLNVSRLTIPCEYKFLVRNTRTGHIIWEEGPNRLLTALPPCPGDAWVQSDLRPQFDAPTPFRAAGTVLPVFSLRSEQSWGVGDFGDLQKLTDWAAHTGQKVLQLLPIHDTTLTGTWQDSYPYNAISVYAFHPLYADMRALPPLSARREKKFEKARQKLNALPQVDYEHALQLKLKRLRLAFEQEGAVVLASDAFLTFWRENAVWLPAYAMFCTLRDRYRTADFTRWPEHSVFSEAELHRFCAPDEKTVRFWYYVQFILHTQLLKASTYARQKNVILKGDIPIGISPHSIEAWTEPALFNVNAQAGAPPDDFSATGQNWGFPTYNWNVMARNHYRWWTHRLKHMARYFDAYRIDHVLGFFRIWEIPSHAVEGLLGQFSPALPLTPDEIAGYGLTFKKSFTHPFISPQLVQKLFGKQAAGVAKKFLLPLGNGLFQLRPAYATQRQIQHALGPGRDEKTNTLRQGLYTLAADVLFVPDRTDLAAFHPRIAALSTAAFNNLSPEDKQAFTRLYNDYFFHRHNHFWEQEALKKLPALTQCTRMLCCAEDLGMIPACVPPVMHQLQMLRLEIQRMPKEPGQLFADTRHYPYLSVATPSTHDMSVLRGWWKENPELTQKFWTDVLHQPGTAPLEADAQTCEEILRMHLESPSMLCLISFQDWTGMDETLRAPDPDQERINVPANPHHYWRYRMPMTLESLMQAHTLNRKIKDMITQAER